MSQREREFEVVFVCTGNRFRSPLAESLLRAATEGLPVRVRSLGMLRVDGEPAFAEAVEAGRTLGVDLSEHRSACIDGVDLSGADLVIGFQFDHVARAVIEAGAQRGRTFLLPELVGLLEQARVRRDDDVVSTAARAVEAAADLRRARGPAPPHEIADPAGRSGKEAAQTVEQIATLTGRLADALFSP